MRSGISTITVPMLLSSIRKRILLKSLGRWSDSEEACLHLSRVECVYVVSRSAFCGVGVILGSRTRKRAWVVSAFE